MKRIGVYFLNLLLAFLGLNVCPGLTNSAIYYVSPSGNDSNPGNDTQPWLTIQKAAKTMVAGETVYIKAGIYRERVIPFKSGTTGNYITYAAYEGDISTIDGSGISLPNWDSGLFHVSSRSYIKISGLRVINAGPNQNNAGIYVENSDHIVIERNYTHNTVSSGIGVWNSNNIVIDGNEVTLSCNDGEQECITVAGTHTFEIKNNHIHQGGPGTLGGEGIDAKDGSSNGKIYKNHVHHLNRLGIYVEAWDKHTYGIEVFQNRVHDIANNDGLALASEKGGLLEDISVTNNISYNNGLSGFSITNAGSASTHPVKDITIINNTFYDNGKSSWGGGISIENKDVQDIVIRNNICGQNLTYQIFVEYPVQNLVVDHNFIDGYKGYKGEIRGTNYKEGDPMFVNPTESDFHLEGTSQAINNGSALSAPNVDFDGYKRPQGEGYDIGAYEFLSTACPDCSGDVVVIDNTTFPSGATCECLGATSITIGPEVVIQSGATVTFNAPIVNVNPGFYAENGSAVYMRQD